jgi:protein-tyrosine-phosphatase
VTDRTLDQINGRQRPDESPHKRLRVLFLCTGNSARSQIAEALLSRKGGEQFDAGSAGVRPRPAVHPDAIDTLAGFGIDWRGRQPKSIDAVLDQPWNFVITVCDRARESCPAFPGQPVFAHWGMPDPADIDDPGRRQQAFRDTATYLGRRIDLLLALPFESLERRALEERLRRIGLATPETAESVAPDAPPSSG